VAGGAGVRSPGLVIVRRACCHRRSCASSTLGGHGSKGLSRWARTPGVPARVSITISPRREAQLRRDLQVVEGRDADAMVRWDAWMGGLL